MKAPEKPLGGRPVDQLLNASRQSAMHQAAIDRLLRGVGLSYARWQVLDACRAGPDTGPAGQGAMGPASIGRLLGHSRQAVQRVVNALAEEGLVALRRSTQDRRAQQVVLLPKGRCRLAEADQFISTYATAHADRIGADEAAVGVEGASRPVYRDKASRVFPVLGDGSQGANAPVRPRRLRAFEYVQQEILGQIRSGHLSTGSQLPPERELAKRMGHGRSAVREALRSLEISGVLHIESGVKGGAFVRESGSDGIQASIRAMLILNRLPLSDLLEVRASLLGQCASLGAVRGNEEDFRLLDENIDALAHTVADVSDQTAAIGAATDFYRLAARASHNPLMVLLVDAMAGLIAEMLATLGRWPRLDAVSPRREMVAAMRLGRAEDAERIIRAHSRETNQMLITYEQRLAVRANL